MTFGAGAAAGHAVNDGFVRHLDGQGGVHIGKGLHGFGLGHGAGEAIEDGALLTVVGGQLFLHQADDQIIGHQLAAVHIGFCLSAQFCALGDGLAQKVSRGDHGNLQRGFDEICLRAFSRAGGTQ